LRYKILFLSFQNFFLIRPQAKKKKYPGPGLSHLAKIIRKLLFIDIYQIPDKFIFRLLAKEIFWNDKTKGQKIRN